MKEISPFVRNFGYRRSFCKNGKKCSLKEFARKSMVKWAFGATRGV